jgi:carboxypeptidase Q
LLFRLQPFSFLIPGIMKSRETRALFSWLLLFSFSAAAAQNPGERVLAEALKPSPLENNLRRLTDEIGGRVPGTTAMQKAVQWGVEAFKASGADRVHTEDFTIASSWAEGPTEIRVIAPEMFAMRGVSVAWAPALSLHRQVPIVDVGSGSAENFAKAGSVSGAIVLVHSAEMRSWGDLFDEYLKAPPTIARAVQAHALAIAFQSTRPHDLLYRHTNAQNGEIDRIPMIVLAREDAGRVARLLASGQKVEADITIPNHIGGPVTTANVTAEIRGHEKPEEFVILGAHLDSWALGTGALDNGCNAALVIDALRAIKMSGQEPRRSIRFILFSGEEEGMVGSHAYADAHLGELDKAAAVVVFDAGIGRVTGFSLGGRKDITTAATALLASLKPLDGTTLTTDAEWGSDHFDFLLQGVPTLVANQEESNYLINYHAMSDTFDKVDISQLKTNVTEAAVITFAIADAPERLGPRLHRAQIEATMRETHLDEQLKTFGVWTNWENRTRGRSE